MKKIIFILVVLLFVFILLFSFWFYKIRDEEKYQNKKYIKTLEKIDYYIPQNEQRYINYKQTHFNLNDEDIVTQVNLNLDKDFYTDTMETLYKNTNYILINKFYYVDKEYVPESLEEITICTKGSLYLVEEAKIQFEKMCQDVQKENLKIRAISAYRDYTYQLNLYNKYLVHDTKKNVDTYSARAGHSEHQSGLTVDLDNTVTDFNNFESTDEFLWLEENAYKYGFILRYPKNKEKITGYSYEAWHYRYVGKEIASYIKKHNITFDEYYVRFIQNKVNYS